MKQTSGSTNNYLYNGNELQNFTNYYTYGFRQQDPQLGRWHAIDKLAESYISTSPYGFAGNNPINNLEILGLGYTYDWESSTYRDENNNIADWDEVFDWVQDGLSDGSLDGGTINWGDGFGEAFGVMFKGAKNVYWSYTDAGLMFYTYDDYSDGNAAGVLQAFWEVISFEEIGETKKDFLSESWNSPLARYLISDNISFDLTLNGALIMGQGLTWSVNFLLRGQDAGVYLTRTVHEKNFGVELDYGINVNLTKFLMPTHEITKNNLTGTNYIFTGGFIYGGTVIAGVNEQGVLKSVTKGAGVGFVIGFSGGIGTTTFGWGGYTP